MAVSASPEELLQAWRRGWCTAQNYALPFRGQHAPAGSGQQRRRLRGQSLDFNDHRPYAHGDDVRHINWRVYATTGQLVLKTFEQEVNPCADIVLDGSCSMAYTSAKQLRCVELSGWLAGTCERQGLKTRLYVCRKSVRTIDVFSEQLVAESFVGESTATLPLHQIPWRTHSLRLLLSDLLYPDDLQNLLHPMGHGAGAGWVYCPYDSGEAQPDWSDHLHFEDVDTGQQRRVSVDGHYLERYRQAYANHVGEIETTCRLLGLFHHRVAADWPWNQVIASLGNGGAQWRP
jgi:hypothetical protein